MILIIALQTADTIGNYSKIIISIKTYLVTSNGEPLTSVKHCEKRLPLK